MAVLVEASMLSPTGAVNETGHQTVVGRRQHLVPSLGNDHLAFTARAAVSRCSLLQIAVEENQ